MVTFDSKYTRKINFQNFYRSAVPTPEGGVSYFHNDIDQRPDSEDERRRCLDNGKQILLKSTP